MSPGLTEQIAATLAEFSSATRLFELRIGDATQDAGTSTLLVEAYVAEDALLNILACDVIALSTSAHLQTELLLGQPASLQITFADGEQESIGGEISAVSVLGSDGGLARYRIRISPWICRLEQVRNSRVWQDKTVVEIVEDVFASYRPAARWRWGADTAPHLATLPLRSYCCQYRESDLDFVRRMLAEDGIGWRTGHTDDEPCLVLFADSTRLDAFPDDRSCQDSAGVRYHRASSTEHYDTVQALVEHKRLTASLTTLQSTDYKAKRVFGAVSPSVTQARRLPAVLRPTGTHSHPFSLARQRECELLGTGSAAPGGKRYGQPIPSPNRAGSAGAVS